jgi:predicted transport protein
MPLFQVVERKLVPLSQSNFTLEKQLQKLVEENLPVAFGCRLVASEFSTGAVHAGRIDTLALSEDNNPVIIEYKKAASSELLTQSLFYLAWLYDHRGDFEKAARKSLGPQVEVDWSAVRVICLAPNYKKFDTFAAQVMPSNLELWTYRLFSNGTLFLEQEILQRPLAIREVGEADLPKNPVMVEAGKKAAITRATSSYTFEEHIEGRPDEIKELVLLAQEYILNLSPSIDEEPKKHYIAYKISKNIVCLEVQNQKIYLFLKLDPKKVLGPNGISRDVTSIGHFGTGDLEVTVKSPEDLEAAKPYIKMAYEAIGG